MQNVDAIYRGIRDQDTSRIQFLMQSCSLKDLTTPPNPKTMGLRHYDALVHAYKKHLLYKCLETDFIFKLIFNATIFHEITSLNPDRVALLTSTYPGVLYLNYKVGDFSIKQLAVLSVRFTENKIRRLQEDPTDALRQRLEKEKLIVQHLQRCFTKA